jgi:hypothetical protein
MNLACECGHTGKLVLRENDQPFSGLWEEYSFEGFVGDSLIITSYKDAPNDRLAAMNPKCPQCGFSGKVKYAK